MTAHILTQNELKSQLHYDPETGIFTWIVNKMGHSCFGKNAGSNSHGYVQIGINGIRYRAHRLAFLYMNGEWPKDQIDHINRIKSDNRWRNLREATQQQNNQNKTFKIRDLPTGVEKRCNKYRANIKINNKNTYLGSFETPELAHIAYIKAKRECHEYHPI